MSTWRKTRFLRWLALGVVLAPVAGCGVIGDVLNPGFLSDLGLDPATIIPQQGTMIVAFKNNTAHSASFYAFQSVDAVDLSQSSKNFSVDVDAGEVKNEVLDCPVGLVSPGVLGADFTAEPLAAIVSEVTVDQGQATLEYVEVQYNGPPLISGIAYTCGDVIEFRLSLDSGGTDNEQKYVLNVRIIPGR